MSKGAQLPELRVWFGKKIRNVRWGRFSAAERADLLEDPQLLQLAQPVLRPNDLSYLCCNKVNLSSCKLLHDSPP